MCDWVGLYCHLNVILVQKLRDCQITGRGEYCKKGERFWKKMWERQKQSLWFLFRLSVSVPLLMRKRFFWEVALINQEKTAGSLLHLKRQDKWLQGCGEITGGTCNHQCGDYKLGFTLFFSSNKAAAAAPTQLCLSVFTSQYANSDAFSKC